MSITPRQVSLRRPWAVWLAVLLAVFGALAPTLSHALLLARGGVSPMAEVCTSRGIERAADTSSTDSPDGQKSALSLVHCPFCLLSTDHVLPAPHPWVHLFVVSGEHEAPAIRQAFFYFSDFTLAAQPRGPPQRQTPVLVA
ncbi:MAG: DUF2946 domain-containing protein [Polaromonas sp.]|nr:DUF2946 domain-containing protein [Polaromonas sp.]